VTTVDELVSLVLNQEGQKQTLRLTCQISREMGRIQCNIVQIILIHRDLDHSEVSFVYQHACWLLL